jgi:ferric-dicitrate binding protein FerR (iron transport regulator)
MKLDKYKHYSIEDFALDPHFKDQVLQPSGETGAFFDNLIAHYPEKREEILQARKLVLQLDRHFHQQLPTIEEKATVYREIMLRHQENKSPVITIWQQKKTWWAMAASILVIAVSVWLLRMDSGSAGQLYTTSLGEIGAYELPDGSTVNLNANSSLRFDNDWRQDEVREVWLKGEAFFKVVKKLSGQPKFVVHTEGPDIEVLGTQFNVNTRPEVTQIMLEEGKIQLKERSGQGEPRVMQEGQLVEYKEGKDPSITSDVDPEKYRLWLDGLFSIDDMTFDQVKAKIEEVYGIAVRVEREEMRRLSLHEGVLPANNMEDLLLHLRILYNDAVISEENGTLYIR